MNILKRLKYVFTSGDAIDALIQKENDDIIKAKEEMDKHRLNLCFKHRQEQNCSHYSEQNCDYCKLLNKLKEYEEKSDG